MITDYPDIEELAEALKEKFLTKIKEDLAGEKIVSRMNIKSVNIIFYVKTTDKEQNY
ncbi:MAG: hypothetical protein ACXADA_16905 [Candidatus Hodarchaeales archaeon]|jgi:hypothetical protein